MNAQASERAAELLWAARTQQRTIAALPADCRPATVDDGWAIQRAIEVPDSRFDDFLGVGLPSLVADAMCGGFVAVGPPATGRDPSELRGHAATMLRNGEQVAAGTGADVLGDPCEAMVWLANELRVRGLGLRAGDLVITGACTPPHPIANGDAMVADFGTLGRVEVAFT